MNNDSPTPRPDDPRRRRPPVGDAPSLLMIGVVLFLVVMSVVAVM